MSESAPSISDINRLSARIAGFVAHLRLNDFHLGPRETASAVELLAAAPLPSLDEARLKLKILLASRREEWRRFDDLFEAYWRAQGRERPTAQRAGGANARSRGPEQALWGRHLDSAGADHAAGGYCRRRRGRAKPAGRCGGPPRRFGAPCDHEDRPSRHRRPARHRPGRTAGLRSGARHALPPVAPLSPLRARHASRSAPHHPRQPRAVAASRSPWCARKDRTARCASSCSSTFRAR